MKFVVVGHVSSTDPSDFGVGRVYVKNVDPLTVCKEQQLAEKFEIGPAVQVMLRLSHPARRLALLPVVTGDPVHE